MPDNTVDLSEILVSPVADMVSKLGEAVGIAQAKMDHASLVAQANLATEHPELAKLGYQVTWYQMPEVTIEMKMTVHYERKSTEDKSARFFLAPYNAKYKSAFTYDVNGASTLKLRIVPVPPVFAAPIPKTEG
ncbi:MAG: hypothetical protein V7609_72 [Verrucomicrobiota bacterium]